MYHISDDRRSRYSCDLIFNALAQLSCEQSLDSITVTSLATRAQVGRATFYRNFDAIPDVLRWKCDAAFDGLFEALIHHYRSLDRTQSNTLFLKPFLRYWEAQPQIIELLVRADRLDILSDALAKLFVRFGARLAPGQGVVHDHFDYYAAMRSGLAINILAQWIKNGRQPPADALSDIILKQVQQSMALNLLL